MKIRRYAPEHHAGCMAVFDSNLPLYFADDERRQFEAFLVQEMVSVPYCVVHLDDTVVGCGGFTVSGDRARLCWGMVLHSHHYTGIGAALLRFRIAEIFNNYDVTSIGIDTSQHAEGFFTRHGFLTTQTIPNGYAPGLHKILMQFTRPA